MRQHHDPKHIEKLLARRTRQGLTWFELAAESGVPATTLQWWHRRLRGAKSTGRRKPAAFVPVVVSEAPVATPPPEALEVIVRAGVRIRVPPSFDPGQLRRVVEALESGC